LPTVRSSSEEKVRQGGIIRLTSIRELREFKRKGSPVRSEEKEDHDRGSRAKKSVYNWRDATLESATGGSSAEPFFGLHRSTPRQVALAEASRVGTTQDHSLGGRGMLVMLLIGKKGHEIKLNLLRKGGEKQSARESWEV